MNVRKRGDQLVAAGLAKTLGEVAPLIDQEAGDCKEARFLSSTISQCTRWLSDGTVDAVIDRGRLVLFDDAQSGIFGDLSKKLRLEMTSLAAALRLRSSLGKGGQAVSAREVEIQQGYVAMAKTATGLVASQFVAAAIDHEVARRMEAERGGEVAAARALLERVRQAILRALDRL
jgi:hypothetical protein